MRVLITGSSGMLGTALCRLLQSEHNNVTGIDLKRPTRAGKPDKFIKCDITNYDRVIKAIKSAKPDVVIHSAAYTDVDGCETNPGRAENVNALGTRHVAEAAHEAGARIIYISTDFVFDGRKKKPYKESDTPEPVNIYGRSKLDGERHVTEICRDRYIIARTSWIFGDGGKNFVDTIVNKAKTQKEIRVVSDQFGSPTYAVDLAGAIKKMAGLMGKQKDLHGIFHITNSDNCSWYKFAQKSLQMANIYEVNLIPIMSGELERPAERPMMSILDNSRFIKLTGRPMRSWAKALDEYIGLKRYRRKKNV